MKKTITTLRTPLPGLVLALLLTFFQVLPAFGQQSITHLVDLQKASSLKTEIRMNAGVLRLRTHSLPKANMQFTYSKEAWEPEVKLENNFFSIIQPDEKNFNMNDNERNEWDIKLPQSLRGDLKMTLGAGEALVNLEDAELNRLELTAGAGDFSLNLAGAVLYELEVSAGVGELSLDLSGKRTNNLKATINGGIGEVDLILPARTGVRVKVNGLGGVDSPGLKKQDGYYVNEWYGKTTYSLEITINGGIGSVDMALK